MSKSIFIFSIIFLSVFTSLESYAQESDATKSVSAGHAAEFTRPFQSSAVVTADDQPTVKTPNRGTVGVPLVNLFPTRDPAPLRTMNSIVAPPVTPPSSIKTGLQHEFHGEFTTIYSITNSIPR